MTRQTNKPPKQEKKISPQIHIVLLTVVILGINFIGALNNSVIQIALPDLSSEIGVRYESLSIIISIYWLAAGISALPSGKFGDIYTPKTVFVSGLCLFAVASILCAMTSSYLLIALFRALQGIGVSVAAVNGVSLLRAIYPPQRIDSAMGFWSASISLGYVAGPSVGGLLVERVGWRSTFGVNGALVALFVVFAVLYLPSATRKKLGFDYLGSCLLAAMITALLLLLSPLREGGWQIGSLISLLVLFLVSAFWFFRHERTTSSPLIDLSIFATNQQFRISLLAGLAYSASIQGLVFLLQYYLQEIQGFSPAQSGSFWMVMSVANLIASTLVGKMSDFTGTWGLAFLGTGLRVAGFASLILLAFINPVSNVSILIIAILILFGFGMGTTAAPLYSLVMSSFKQEDTGTVAGTYNTIRHISSSIGVALFSQSLLFAPILFGNENQAWSVSFAFVIAFVVAALGLVFLLRIRKSVVLPETT